MLMYNEKVTYVCKRWFRPQVHLAHSSISHSNHGNGHSGTTRAGQAHPASQPSNIFKLGYVIDLVSRLYSISSEVLFSLSMYLYKVLDPESHLRRSTTGPHSLSEEPVPLVCSE